MDEIKNITGPNRQRVEEHTKNQEGKFLNHTLKPVSTTRISPIERSPWQEVPTQTQAPLSWESHPVEPEYYDALEHPFEQLSPSSDPLQEKIASLEGSGALSLSHAVLEEDGSTFFNNSTFTNAMDLCLPERPSEEAPEFSDRKSTRTPAQKIEQPLQEKPIDAIQQGLTTLKGSLSGGIIGLFTGIRFGVQKGWNYRRDFAKTHPEIENRSQTKLEAIGSWFANCIPAVVGGATQGLLGLGRGVWTGGYHAWTHPKATVIEGAGIAAKAVLKGAEHFHQEMLGVGDMLHQLSGANREKSQ